MFTRGFFPDSYFPPSYFPKDGAEALVGGFGVGGRRRNFRLLADVDAARREHRRLIGRRMSYRTFVEAIEKIKVHSEIRRRQQMLTAAAYSVLLGEV